jgi:hypothetical protein
MAEELAVGDVAEPALADEGGADKGGWEADADNDLPEEVVIVENLGYRGRHQCWGMPLGLAINTWFLLRIGPGKSKPAPPGKMQTSVNCNILLLSPIHITFRKYGSILH